VTAASFDFTKQFVENLPPASGKWSGFPTYNFVGGHNAPESIPVRNLVEAATSVLGREAPTLAMYKLHSGPLGYLPLREFLVAKLKRQADIDCTADEILITTGSLQAIDLVNQVLLNPGDTVVIEQSNYGGVLTRLKRLNVNAVTIPVDDDGMRVDVLAQELAKLADAGIRPKYIYTIPTVHNPTATIMPIERRKEVLRLAEQYDVAIFEDECYSDLVWSGERPPALHGLDQSGRVMFCSTFSKSIAPALRVGYLVAPWGLLSQVVGCKNDAGSGAVEQMLLGEWCPAHFDQHVASLNQLLEKKLDILIDAMNENFGTSVEFKRPPGGIFLWVRLAENVDTTKLTQIAAAKGIAINPGIEWTKDQPDGNRHIRICYASATPDELRNGIKALADVCHEHFGVPERSANRAR
jgi:2-aminoadipate transaminase